MPLSKRLSEPAAGTGLPVVPPAMLPVQRYHSILYFPGDRVLAGVPGQREDRDRGRNRRQRRRRGSAPFWGGRRNLVGPSGRFPGAALDQSDPARIHPPIFAGAFPLRAVLAT